MPEDIVELAKTLRKWDIGKYFRPKTPKIPKEDPNLSRTAYATYRKGKTRSPEAILKTLSYNQWRKARKEAARPK